MARPSTRFALVAQSEDDEESVLLPAGLSVSVVIPTRNEAQNIPLVLERLPSGLTK